MAVIICFLNLIQFNYLTCLNKNQEICERENYHKFSKYFDK